MAKINFTALTNDDWLPDLYHSNTFELTTKTATKIVFTDDNGMMIVATGKGLKASKDGTVTAGKVTALSFLNDDGAALMTVKGINLSAAAVYKSAAKSATIENLISFVTSGNDTITGSSNSDQLIPGSNRGNDTILGAGGDDFISGSAGNNKMDGGLGFDVLSYQDTYFDKASAKKGIVLDAAKGTVKNSWGGTDHISNFEHYRGSHLADTMKGSARDEHFSGLGGRDMIDGGAGFDTLRFERDEKFGGKQGVVVDLARGTARDGFGTVDTIKNIEAARGTAFDDQFTGDGQDNSFRGYDGKDTFDGGAGKDIVSFLAGSYTGGHGITVDMTLASEQVRDDGFGNVETLKNMEIISGSEFEDDITLGAADFTVWGGDGNDRLTAGTGENRMEGNGGADTFVFNAPDSSPAGTTSRDFIADFSQGEGDRIDLQGLGPLTFNGEGGHVEGLATVAFFVNTDGNTVVGADIDGNGTADLQFLIQGKPALSVSDFLLA